MPHYGLLKQPSPSSKLLNQIHSATQGYEMFMTPFVFQSNHGMIFISGLIKTYLHI